MLDSITQFHRYFIQMTPSEKFLLETRIFNDLIIVKTFACVTVKWILEPVFCVCVFFGLFLSR